MDYEIVLVELKHFRYDTRITLKTKASKIMKFLGFKTETKIYIGSCSCWNEVLRNHQFQSITDPFFCRFLMDVERTEMYKQTLSTK
jgi:hypothetical protein